MGFRGSTSRHYCADSGSKLISTAQTLAPNKSLLCRLWLQTNLYCADSGSKQISTAQILAPNESLLRRLWLQTNIYCADSGSKRISYCADSGSKLISTAQTLAPNESLLRRLWLQTNIYCADSGSKRISTAQTRAPNDITYSRWQQSHGDVFASLFYSGRKRRRVVRFFTVYGSSKVSTKTLYTLIRYNQIILVQA